MEVFIILILSIVTYVVAIKYVEYKDYDFKLLEKFIEENIKITELEIKKLIEMGAADDKLIDYLIGRVDAIDKKVDEKFELVNGEITKIKITIAKWVGGAFAASSIVSIFVNVYF